jgi:hypothetical protein
MNGSEQLTVNGKLVWGYVVELVDGLRFRVSIDEWQRLDLHRGQRVTVQRGVGPELGMVLAETTNVPPVTWVVLARVTRAAG